MSQYTQVPDLQPGTGILPAGDGMPQGARSMTALHARKLAPPSAPVVHEER
jgi:hypothetical protein